MGIIAAGKGSKSPASRNNFVMRAGIDGPFAIASVIAQVSKIINNRL